MKIEYDKKGGDLTQSYDKSPYTNRNVRMTFLLVFCWCSVGVLLMTTILLIVTSKNYDKVVNFRYVGKRLQSLVRKIIGRAGRFPWWTFQNRVCICTST